MTWQAAIVSKPWQALRVLPLTLTLKYTLLPLADKIWFDTYSKGFSQRSGTIILQTISASHKYLQSKRLALGTWFPVTLFQGSSQYLKEAEVVYTTSPFHCEHQTFCVFNSQAIILQTLPKYTCFYNMLYKKTATATLAIKSLGQKWWFCSRSQWHLVRKYVNELVLVIMIVSPAFLLHGIGILQCQACFSHISKDISSLHMESKV